MSLVSPALVGGFCTTRGHLELQEIDIIILLELFPLSQLLHHKFLSDKIFDGKLSAIVYS